MCAAPCSGPLAALASRLQARRRSWRWQRPCRSGVTATGERVRPPPAPLVPCASRGAAEPGARARLRARRGRAEGSAQGRGALLRSGARRQTPRPQFSLGWMYANGRGVAHDDASRRHAFRARRGATGHAYAQRMLGASRRRARRAARLHAAARASAAASWRTPMTSPIRSSSFRRRSRRSPTCVDARRAALRHRAAAGARGHRGRIELRAHRALGRRTRAG